jgi:hypothetical protein
MEVDGDPWCNGGSSGSMRKGGELSFETQQLFSYGDSRAQMFTDLVIV